MLCGSMIWVATLEISQETYRGLQSASFKVLRVRFLRRGISQMMPKTVGVEELQERAPPGPVIGPVKRVCRLGQGTHNRVLSRIAQGNPVCWEGLLSDSRGWDGWVTLEDDDPVIGSAMRRVAAGEAATAGLDGMAKTRGEQWRQGGSVSFGSRALASASAAGRRRPRSPHQAGRRWVVGATGTSAAAISGFGNRASAARGR